MQPSHGLAELSVIWPASASSKSCPTYYCLLFLIHSNHTGFLTFLWTCLRAFALAGTSAGHTPFPPDLYLTASLTSFKHLLKYHLPREAFPGPSL